MNLNYFCNSNPGKLASMTSSKSPCSPNLTSLSQFTESKIGIFSVLRGRIRKISRISRIGIRIRRFLVLIIISFGIKQLTAKNYPEAANVDISTSHQFDTQTFRHFFSLGNEVGATLSDKLWLKVFLVWSVDRFQSTTAWDPVGTFLFDLPESVSLISA